MTHDLLSRAPDERALQTRAAVGRANDEIRLITALAQIERVLDLGVLQPSFHR